MQYFHGFSLEKEETLFHSFITPTDYTIAGFSYGAQKAFDYVYHTKRRIDRLILLSPAFFQTQKSSFTRTQLRYFDTNQDEYVKQFLENVAFPSNLSLDQYLNVGTKKELESLLTYVWDQEKIKTVLSRGTIIEVFLGTEDKIIDIQEAIDFFNESCTTYIVKKSGHLLSEY